VYLGTDLCTVSHAQWASTLPR